MHVPACAHTSKGCLYSAAGGRTFFFFNLIFSLGPATSRKNQASLWPQLAILLVPLQTCMACAPISRLKFHLLIKRMGPSWLKFLKLPWTIMVLLKILSNFFCSRNYHELSRIFAQNYSRELLHRKSFHMPSTWHFYDKNTLTWVINHTHTGCD